MFNSANRSSLGNKVVRNVLFSGARLIILAPLPFVLVPYFLKKVGTSGYGTWAVFLAISGLTSAADCGLITTLSKHVAEYYAIKDFAALNRIVNTGFALYMGIAASLAVLMELSSSVLIQALFRTSTVPFRELHRLWQYLIAMIVANALTLLFSSVAVGLQRMDVSNTLASMNLMLSGLLAIALLHVNASLLSIARAYTLAAWITALCYCWFLRRLLPQLRPALASCTWSATKEIFSFSSQAYLTQVAVAVHNQIEKVYLARFTGVVAAGWYEIISDLALKLRSVPGLVLAPMMPAASELNALNSQRRLADLYFRTHKYLAFLGIPFVAYVAFASKSFIRLWLGPNFANLATPFSILVAVHFVNLITGPGFLMLIGTGKLRPGVYSALLGIGLNVSFSFFLIHSYGFHGAVVGTSGALIIASLSFLYLFRRSTGGEFAGTIRKAYLPPLICAVLGITVLYSVSSGWALSWGTILLRGAAFAFSYLVMLLVARFFDTFDLALAEQFFRVPKIARRIVPNVELGSPIFPNS